MRDRPLRPLAGLIPRTAHSAGLRLIDWAVDLPASPLGLRTRPATAQTEPALIVPADLLVSAWRQLFPAERMIFIGGQRRGSIVRATSIRDVTGEVRSAAYVRSSPAALHQALLDWEATGSHVAAWLHSHPGTTPMASHPSAIDRRQEVDLRTTYGVELVSFIATQDGYLRIWGKALEDGRVVKFQGNGIDATEETNVYKLAVR